MMSVTALFLLCWAIAAAAVPATPRTGGLADTERWGYVNVRENAFMFWWLYYSTATGDQPLVLWLQGGPGSSSTGYGNFAELGPLDLNLNPRNITWIQTAHVVFVDNPVGTGFSYTTDSSAFVTDNQQIADDLVVLLQGFLDAVPEFQTVPLFIFSESYGGKMAIGFANALYQAIQSGQVTANFKGVALGDSWISPVDSVITWSEYLYTNSLVDEVGRDAIYESASRCQRALDNGNGALATEYWALTEDAVIQYADDVNFYNILLRPEDTARTAGTTYLEKLYYRHVQPKDALDDLMNGPIREKLGIIPDDVIFGSQSNAVFNYLQEDFMKPVVETVEAVLNNTDIDVVVFSGQLDLIVDTLGTLAWVNRLRWSGSNDYPTAERRTIPLPEYPVSAYVKKHDRLIFYWILKSGHMVPTDAPAMALKMVEMATKNNNEPF